MQRVCDYIAKWMGVIVLLVAALSLIVPSSLAWIGTWVINPMLGIIMFGMGLTLSANDLKIVLSRPKDILIGCLTQFTVMPLLAWCLTKVFSLPQELAIGVILVGCCPGGTASNVITYLAKGDLALSVGMTAASTLLAPIVTPLLVWLLAGTMVDVHTTGMLMSIVYIVILPIVCGLLCQRERLHRAVHIISCSIVIAVRPYVARLSCPQRSIWNALAEAYCSGGTYHRPRQFAFGSGGPAGGRGIHCAAAGFRKKRTGSFRGEVHRSSGFHAGKCLY